MWNDRRLHDNDSAGPSVLKTSFNNAHTFLSILIVLAIIHDDRI